MARPLTLRRVFMNLIVNAMKYAGPPLVSLCFTEQGAEVAVRDAGPGIPPEALKQAFLPFHRLDHSRNRMAGGVGLGWQQRAASSGLIAGTSGSRMSPPAVFSQRC
jgi:signal transduction histidine kinase